MDNHKSNDFVRQFELGDVKNDSQRDTVVSKSFGQSIRVLFQNWRQGTVACKGRSDVARTNKKPWKQKGTGRARAGSARSPLWRGGGVIHGPQARVAEFKINKKLRQNVFYELFLQRVNLGRISVVNWDITGDVPVSREAAKMLQMASLSDKKVLLFVNSSDWLVQKSFANFHHVKSFYFDQPNAYDLAYGYFWVVLKKDEEAFKEMVNRWL